jgi:diguanylate cyclase (GGDEF)-like protein/PAS domain S-box-containing protein
MVFPRFLPTSLHNRVLILTLAGFLISAVAITTLIFRYIQNDSIHLLVEQQQTMVDMVSRQMDSALQKRMLDLEKFAGTLHSRTKLHSNRKIQEALKQDTLLQSLFNGGLVVLNRQGISVVDYPMVPNRTGIDFSDRKHLKKARSKKASVISKPLVGKGLNTPLFAINSPIISASGEILGFIFGVNVLAEDNLLKEISRQNFSDGGRMVIIDPNLKIFVTDTQTGVPLESYLKDNHCECIEAVLEGNQSGISQDLLGNSIIYASAEIDKMDWIVIRTYPLQKAMVSINQLTNKIVLVSLIIILLMGLLIAFFLKQLLTPLTQASREIRKMADGQLSEHMLTVRSHDEVGQLIQAFNQLHRTRYRYEHALKESEERYRLTMEATETGLWSWDLTDDSIHWDSQCYKMLGFKDQAFQLTRKLFRKLMHPEDQIRFYINFLPQMLNNHTAEIEVRLLTNDNKWLWVQSRGKPIRFGRNNHPLCIAGTHLNFEKQRQTEQLHLAAAAFEANDAIMIVDSEGKIAKVNNAFSKITGYSGEDTIGQSPALLSSGIHKDPFYTEMRKSLDQTGKWQGEIWNRHKEGEVYIAWLNINTLYNDDGSIYQRIAVFSDITEKKRTEELIWKQANFDPLTNLPNRRMFMDRLAQEIRLASRSETSLALLFLDLDRFKEVNDTLGHNVGDQLLVEVANRFRKLVRSSDTIARLGGDEFTLILPQIDNNTQVDQVANKILTTLKQPFEINQQSLNISASIGATLYPQDGEYAEQLIKNADQAMYAAKDAGRSTLHYFTPSMQTLALKRATLIKELRKAIDESQFQLYYQPIIDLQSRRVIKAEALIRWNHPIQGLQNPHQFIQEAEDSGLILEIDDWVFREALQQVSLWRSALSPDLQLCVNTSAAHFESSSVSSVPERWIQLIKESDIHGATLDSSSAETSFIGIEIKEHLLTESSAETKQRIQQLREVNIQVTLDNFGAGFSSLTHLNQLDIDYIKIDRDFIRTLQSDTNNMVLCNAIIVMAHTLGLKVIAEGVETHEQQELLLQAHCDYVQGFYYEKAMTAEQFEHWYVEFSEQKIALAN